MLIHNLIPIGFVVDILLRLRVESVLFIVLFDVYDHRV